MSEPDVRQVLVHPVVWPHLELWLAGRGLVLARVPVEDDLPTYAMVLAAPGDAEKVIRDAARQAAGQPAAILSAEDAAAAAAWATAHEKAADCPQCDDTGACNGGPCAHPAAGQPDTQQQPQLTAAERQFLTFALDLAADRMANRGDEFDEDDEAALARLRRMTDRKAGR